MKKIFIALLLLFTAACSNADGVNINEPENIVLEAPAGLTFDTAIVKYGDVENVYVYDGYVRVISDSLYFTDNNLRIDKIYVTEGSLVKKGDVLASVDEESVLEPIQKQEKTIENLKRTYAHDNAVMTYDIEIAKLELLTTSDAEAKKLSIEKLELSLAQAKEKQEYELEVQIRKLDELKAKYKSSDLIAPYDGRIVKLQNLSSGTLTRAYVPVAYIADDKNTCAFYPGNDFIGVYNEGSITGKVHNKTYQLESMNSPYAEGEEIGGSGVYFNITNSDDDVEPGQFMQINCVNEKVENVLVIPVNALYFGNDKESYVYIDEDGKKNVRVIKTGLRNESVVQIISGLEEGDKIYVKQ